MADYTSLQPLAADALNALLPRVHESTLIISKEKAQERKAPGYDAAINHAYTGQRLPPADGREARLIFMEPYSGMKENQPEFHGSQAYSYAAGVLQALGADDVPVHFVNRMLHEDGIGKVPDTENMALLHNSCDPAQGFFQPYAQGIPDQADASRKALHGSGVNIVATSVSFETAALTHEEHEEALKRLRGALPGDTLLVKLAGNEADRQAIGYHPNSRTSALDSASLLIGAAAQVPTRFGFHAITVEPYSSAGAQLSAAIAPRGAAFIGQPAMDGTSAATPEAAAMLAALARQVGKDARHTGLSGEDIQLVMRLNAKVDTVMEKPGWKQQSHNDSPYADRLMPFEVVGQRCYTQSTGSGFRDLPRALEHASRMLEAVEAGKADFSRAKDICVNASSYARNAQGRYVYIFRPPPHASGPLYADRIFVGFEAQADAANQLIRHSGDMLLIGPDQARTALHPSNSESGFHKDVACAFQGMKLEGEWKIISQRPLERVQLTFLSPLTERHAAIVAAPDFADMERKRYAHATFERVDPKELNARFFSSDAAFNAEVRGKDFSTTAFPENYLESTLVALVEAGKRKQAEEVLDTGYPGFEGKTHAIRALISKGNASALRSVLTLPETEKTPDSPLPAAPDFTSAIAGMLEALGNTRIPGFMR